MEPGGPTTNEPEGADHGRSADPGTAANPPPRPSAARPPGPPPPAGAPFRPEGRPRRTEEPGRKDAPGRRPPGFGDGVDRAYCALFRHVAPTGFPVQHRLGATRPTAVVAARPGFLLLCDSAHPDNHQWPNHEPVLEEERHPTPDRALSISSETGDSELRTV